ncbi:uncharacterized protein Tco025E_09077 [Trypanosoma conorhini]|uniref:Uncharacterized protein n=1 Tax=Trypanosoma conorhini TaxID=83891 RepID=A0A422N102_9TRYP|nr:uncharacterized protein Tco025E_09077 [Trypanosoma conorhini]RNE99145.1 hypothetical protein Tco025E_09077 [Trypanosoma conorhini]
MALWVGHDCVLVSAKGNKSRTLAMRLHLCLAPRCAAATRRRRRRRVPGGRAPSSRAGAKEVVGGGRGSHAACRPAAAWHLQCGCVRWASAAGDGALQASDAPVAEDDCAREGAKLWGAGNPFRRPVKIERECGAQGAEAVRYTNVCCLFGFSNGDTFVCGASGPQRVPLAVTACRSPS